MPDLPLHLKTIVEVGSLIGSRQLSPVEVTTALLERIEVLDRDLMSYATLMADHALKSARKSEDEISRGGYRGPLHGVPVAVKDLCFTSGVRTMGGSRVNSDHIPDFDATVVARLEAAGAVACASSAVSGGLRRPYEDTARISRTSIRGRSRSAVCGP